MKPKIHGALRPILPAKTIVLSIHIMVYNIMVKNVFLQVKGPHLPFSKEKLLKDIQAARPNLRGKFAYAPKSGRSANTLIIGHEVFKGPHFKQRPFEKSPKRKKAIEVFFIEAAVIQKLTGKILSSYVPQFTGIQKDPAWFSMTFLPDIELKKALYTYPAEILLQAYDDAAHAIGLFMSDLQKSVPLAGAPESWIAKDPELKLDTLMDSPEIKKILGSLLPVCITAHERLNAFQPVFTHGDLQPSNILVDANTGKVTSVIDFGHARFRSPIGELARLHNAYSADFVDKIRITYSQTQDQKVNKSDIVAWDIATQIIFISKILPSGNKHLLGQAIQRIGNLTAQF